MNNEWMKSNAEENCQMLTPKVPMRLPVELAGRTKVTLEGCT